MYNEIQTFKSTQTNAQPFDADRNFRGIFDHDEHFASKSVGDVFDNADFHNKPMERNSLNPNYFGESNTLQNEKNTNLFKNTNDCAFYNNTGIDSSQSPNYFGESNSKLKENNSNFIENKNNLMFKNDLYKSLEESSDYPFNVSPVILQQAQKAYVIANKISRLYKASIPYAPNEDAKKKLIFLHERMDATILKVMNLVRTFDASTDFNLIAENKIFKLMFEDDDNSQFTYFCENLIKIKQLLQELINIIATLMLINLDAKMKQALLIAKLSVFNQLKIVKVLLSVNCNLN